MESMAAVLDAVVVDWDDETVASCCCGDCNAQSIWEGVVYAVTCTNDDGAIVVVVVVELGM